MTTSQIDNLNMANLASQIADKSKRLHSYEERHARENEESGRSLLLRENVKPGRVRRREG